MQLPVLWNQEQCVHTGFAAKTARWIPGDGYFLCGTGRIPQSSWLQIVSKDAEQISIIKHWDTWISCKQLKKILKLYQLLKEQINRHFLMVSELFVAI